MARRGWIKLFIVLAFSAVIAAALFASYRGDNFVSNIKADGEEPLSPNSVTLSSDGWDRFTYRNAPELSEPIFDGADAYYYELPYSADDFYSVTATLTSPKLDIYAREYTLGFKYFTRQIEEIANEITVYTSYDGKKFKKTSSFLCYDSGAETVSWREGTLKVALDGYVRFELKVFYAGEGSDKIEHAGIYLCKDFTLTATPSAGLRAEDFYVSASGTEFTYNGAEQRPELIVETEVESAYYVRSRVSECEQSVNAGHYTLRAEIFDDANALVAAYAFPYEILPQSIELTECFAVKNNDYTVINDAVFTDGAGRTVSLAEVGCKRIYGNATEPTLVVDNPNFLPYSTAITARTELAAGYLYYIDDKDVSYVYDGEAKGLGEHIRVFSEYDFDTETFTEIPAWVNITYKRNGELAEPVNAGTYDYFVEYGDSVFRGTVTVLPAVITEAEYVGGNLDKFFDGTEAVCENGQIVKTLTGLTPAGGIEGLTLQAEKTLYARDIGKTYPIAYGVTVSGEGAENYIAAEEVYVAAEGFIAPITLYWENLTDVNGTAVEIAVREYDGTAEAEFLSEENGEAVALDIIGAGGYEITYFDIELTASSPNVGQREVEATLINARMYDKFTSEITLGKPLYAEILRKPLMAEAVDFTAETKTYDGTADSAVRILKLDFIDIEDFGDGFAELVGGDYLVGYESAVYSAPEAGDRTITVSNIRLFAYDEETQLIFDNYIVEEVTVLGHIDPMTVTVFTQMMRIYVGQSMPDVEISESIAELLGYAIYGPGGVGGWADSSYITQTGNYYVEVYCLSGNYVLDGSTVFDLEITEAQDYAPQTITFAGIDVGLNSPITPLAVPSGGKFVIDAQSVDAYGRKTGLRVTCAVSGRIAVLNGGVFEVNGEGSFSVTFSCEGNSHYQAAEDKILYFKALTFTANAIAPAEVVYAGDGLPQLDARGFTPSGQGFDGYVFPRESEKLIAGTQAYGYYFVANTASYAPQYVDTAIYGVRYEKTELGYAVTADKEYMNGKTYYELEVCGYSDKDENDEDYSEFASNGVYRAAANGAYELVTELNDREAYYYLKPVKDEGMTVRANGFYTYDGENYVPVSVGDSFVSGEKYYVEGRPFVGELPLNVILDAGKRTLTVTVGGEQELAYGEKVDLRSLITGIRGENGPVPIYVAELISDIKLYKISSSDGITTEENVTDCILDIGRYTIGRDGEEASYLLRASAEEYAFEFEGEAQLDVDKSDIVVFARNTEKYYRTPAITEEGLKSGLSVQGSYDGGDLGEIFESVSAQCAASAVAAAGEYVISLDGPTETDRYRISYRQGYLKVIPARITVNAITPGHVYGTGLRDIDVSLSLSSIYGEEERRELEKGILPYITVGVSATSDSPVGDYPIDIAFSGDLTSIDLQYADAYYRITPAVINGVRFLDSKVLYDGERHTLEVSYDKNLWNNLTVEYNNTYFIERGVYEYVAVVSAENYYDLTLRATLTISTLTLTGSSLTTNFVRLSLDEEICPSGISPTLKVALNQKDGEGAEQLSSKIENAKGDGNFKILASYDIGLTDEDGESVTLLYDEYMISFRPSSLTYGSGLKLYGYGKEGYGELEYEYSNGIYTVKAASLKDLTFIKETVETVNPIFIWIAVAICILLIIIVLASVAGGGKRARREHRRSRRRHHRWA